MAIDMTTVKAISYNNKDVVKIEDGQGNILWQAGTPPTPVDFLYVASSSSANYQFEIINDTVSRKTWIGVQPAAPQMWYDGTEIRYNPSNYTWTLDTSTNTWTRASSGISLNGGDMWSDGTNIYAGNANGAQYIYDKVNKTWSPYTWGTPVDGITSPAGWKIWSDGTNYLCSPANDSKTYKLDTNTNAWEYYFTGNWDAREFWSPDGGNTIYYSNNGTKRYDKVNHVLTNVTGGGGLYGANIFKYNNKIYAIKNDKYLYELTIDTTTDTITQVKSDMYIANINVGVNWCFWDLNGKRSLSMQPTPNKSNT